MRDFIIVVVVMEPCIPCMERKGRMWESCWSLGLVASRSPRARTCLPGPPPCRCSTMVGEVSGCNRMSGCVYVCVAKYHFTFFFVCLPQPHIIVHPEQQSDARCPLCQSHSHTHAEHMQQKDTCQCHSNLFPLLAVQLVKGSFVHPDVQMASPASLVIRRSAFPAPSTMSYPRTYTDCDFHPRTPKA